MAKGQSRTQKVKYGGVTVLVRPRNDGRWVIYWREARRPRQTTAQTEKEAVEVAKEKAREISGKQGGRVVTIEDSQVLELVRKLAGNRPAFAWLREMEDCQTRLKGASIPRAVQHFLASGAADLVQVTFATAKDSYLQTFNTPGMSKFSSKAPRQELAAFDASHTGVMLEEITKPVLQQWIARPVKGDESPSRNTFNNRVKTWKAFLNWCQEPEQKMLAPGEPHAAASIERLEVRTNPKIWTSEVARAILAILPETLRPYLIIGCWFGPRPTEIERVRWELFDWKRGYLHIDDTVAEKTPDQRFVPMCPLARKLLEPWKDAKGLCCPPNPQHKISKLARAAKIITKWEVDVMRHSYISYQIANGVSKGQVAEWTGNSETIIKKHYRRPLRREDGKAWFAVAA
ncbi:hypothetical protein SAMN02745166_01519 [Prosthecobacter debontii]|uniref:Tyr recombinase domain-containing protein n=1 Tax=Prosthecobacter debontii TaxID=48467 RepID=A0A1T4XHH9_9BACT|nr:hypothetical protein [Prosthecobacter debontii]SKA88989.1 hypothetical protein SAMN02745166_01519 [Prosthecobacter debontii]